VSDKSLGYAFFSQGPHVTAKQRMGNDAMPHIVVASHRTAKRLSKHALSSKRFDNREVSDLLVSEYSQEAIRRITELSEEVRQARQRVKQSGNIWSADNPDGQGPYELRARQIGGCFAFGVGLVARYTLQTRAATEIHPVRLQQRLVRRQSVKKRTLMKVESIADILKILKPVLTAKTVLYTALAVAVAFWVSFLFPQIFAPLKLDAWRANNDTLIGVGIIASSITLLIVLLVNLDSWVSARLRRGRDKRFVRRLFRDLSASELEYLYQFIWHRTTTIEFDGTDPVVGLLQTKDIIYPSSRVYIGRLAKYKCRFGHGEPFNIAPIIYKYLIDHPELFRKVVSKDRS